jgi:hypothetical protein
MRVQWAAPFLSQKTGISCWNAHAFNRLLSLQVVAYLQSGEFSSDFIGFPDVVSLHVLSSLRPPSSVVLAFIEAMNPAAVPTFP